MRKQYYPNDYTRDFAVTVYEFEKRHGALNSEAQGIVEVMMTARGFDQEQAKKIAEQADIDYISIS